MTGQHDEAGADFAAVTISRTAGVATLELCRPELLNRFDDVLHTEFPQALDILAHDPDVLVAVLCSTGRAFSAGGDTQIMLDAASSLPRRLRLIDDGRRLFKTCADFPKPLVVALEGDAYGLGATIALMGDVIVAHAGVKLADTHIRMGITAGDGGVVAWPMNVGMAVAKRHLLTGDPISGERAYQLGAVTDLVATREEVRPLAFELATRIASYPPMAVQLTKRAFAKMQAARVEDAFDLGFYLEALSFGTDDLLEAVAAFTEKRAGTWTGR